MLILKISRKQTFHKWIKSIRNSHYFVIPEIPNDTIETNPALRTGKFPFYNELTPKKMFTAVLKRSIDFDSKFNKLIIEMKSNQSLDTKSFEKYLISMEHVIGQLDQSYKLARHMAYLYPYSEFMSCFLSIQTLVQIKKNSRWTNRNFFEILKIYETKIEQFSETQLQFYKKFKNFCELNGLSLVEKKYLRLQELNFKINNEQNNFKKKLKYSTDKFSFVVNDKSLISEIPKNILGIISISKVSSEKGPWAVTLRDNVFQAFIENCSNQQLRKLLFENYYGRASYLSETPFQNNSETIKNIINYRNERANLLGYKNHAEFILKNTSAMKTENVIELIETIRSKVKPLNEEDFITLQNYANKNNHSGPLNIYDIDYWKKKHYNEVCRTIPEAKFMQYFKFNNVLHGMINYYKFLFNIDFVETKEKTTLWSNDVTIFDVYENGKMISTLVIDPYIRSGKIDNIWSYSGRDCSMITDSKPIAHLVLNLRNVGPNTLINVNQMKKMFGQFGKCLQILLTKTDFTENSDLKTFEIDALSITSKVFEKFLFVPEVLNQLSEKNGEPLPDIFYQTIKSTSMHMKSFEVLRECYYSALDLECHISDKPWTEIMEDLWPKFMPAKQLKNDFHPCQFVPAFGENQGALYYADLWSEMLSADIFEAFNEIGFQDKKNLYELSKRFRETFLCYGSSISVNEVFRRFRGRNPSIEPLIDTFTKK